jgi:hypothetical protein
MKTHRVWSGYGHHYAQHNDTQHKVTQHNGFQYKNK